jgi:DNA-binding response OmpR family regulator
MQKEKILLVDDEEDLLEALTAFLKLENFDVKSIKNGNEVIPTLSNEPFNLVILDISLKDIIGFEVLKEIRRHFPRIPVIIFSAWGEIHKQTRALENGADDYIIKPYENDLLVAKIRTHIKRVKRIVEDVKSTGRGVGYSGFCEYKSLKLDKSTFKLYKNNKYIDELKLSHFRLLKFFMENPGENFTNEQLHNAVWDDSNADECYDNTITVYIGKLRKLIEDDPENPQFIHTIPKYGYRFS